MIQAGNCIVEVPTRHVAERGGGGHELEFDTMRTRRSW